jgi:hypothetical protein
MNKSFETLKYLIWSPEYNEAVGGIIALHKLAESIAKLGIECYITTHQTISGSLAKPIAGIPNFRYDPLTTMVIYPEIIVGNPLNAMHITRWLLNTPGICGGDGIYSSNDLVYTYSDYYYSPVGKRIDGKLWIYDFKTNVFYNENRERSGECFIVKKGKNKELNNHRPDSICIEPFPGDDALREIFNTCEYFICYDDACFHTIQAALCGCIPIVIPREDMGFDEYMEKNEMNRCGIAYGFDSIEHAKNTQHLLLDHINSIQRESANQLEKYIERCVEHMNLI